MGNACLGAPRKNAQLMRKKNLPEQHYNNAEEPMYKANEAVAGESEGNRLKIKVNLITCAICMQSYNVTSREPQIVCENNHTYCKECALQSKKTKGKCPQCRAVMREPIRNRDLFQLVEDNQNIIEENKMEPVPIVEGDQQVLTVDTNNECIGSFWVQDNRVMKIQNNRVWQGFLSQEVLPKDKESSFTIKVMYTQFGNIKLGIVGKGYKCEKGVICKEAVVYHLADGKILEGGRGEGSEWKGQGQKIDLKSGTEVFITCRVSPKEGRVTWLHDDKILGQGRFSKYLKQHDFVAYFLLSHKEDVIELNT